MSLVFLGLVAVLAIIVITQMPRAEAGGGGWLDTSNRAAVVEAYQSEFAGTQPTMGWVGDRASCAAGNVSAAYRQASVDRVNYFRGMAGVPTGVVENADLSARAQQAALMMQMSGRLSHSPDSSFECFTDTGRTASQNSNLYLGINGPQAITGYMEDPGGSNTWVGHRNWLLHPTTREVGVGDLPTDGRRWSSNAMWITQNAVGPQPPVRESEGWVAWPPRGYVPGELVFNRWSLSLRGADFSSASVTMKSNSGAVGANVVHRDGKKSGAPFAIMVWEPQGIDVNPATDASYEVTVSGVKVNGSTRNFTYVVTILGDQPGSNTVSSSTANSAANSAANATTNAGASSGAFAPFVQQAFQDFIGRAPSNSELNYWTGRLSSGTSRGDFVSELSRTEAWTAGVIDSMYQSTLGRAGDPNGQAFWAKELQNGRPVADVASNFYGSAEYVQRVGGTYELWVSDLYAELLGRNPDAGGSAYWVNRANEVGIGTVAYQFYQSEENRQARVREMYLKFLGREPDAGGLAHWTQVLSSGDDLALASVLAASDEYWNRTQ